MEFAMDVANMLGYSFPQRTDFPSFEFSIIFSSPTPLNLKVTFLSFPEAKL